MSLEKAHTGYAYQDRLSVYFILKEILKGSNTTFIFDYKEYNSDKFDDLTISNEFGIFKKQIKHSDGSIEFQKNYLARDSGGYDLGLDSLYESYKNYPEKDNLSELRICTTWSKPLTSNNILKYITEFDSIEKSFSDSLIYKVNIDNLWNTESGIDSSWRNFKKYIEENNISRDELILFLDKLVIEINLPEFSMNVEDMGKLEKNIEILLQKLGIGTFPNDKINEKETLLKLAELVNNKRSSLNKKTGIQISINEILRHIGINQTYGSIEQKFPIEEHKNITNNNFSEEVIKKLESSNKIFVKGEPGAGKSWFVENFQTFLLSKSIKFAKHYCYISLEDSLSSNRIKTNTFFGNLINDILLSFPDLKFQKEKLYASDLNELNLLIDNIDEDFILIIDGLDHINRISKLDKNISNAEVDIIEHLSKLKLNNKTKLIVFSQPLEKDFEGFEYISLPVWDKEIIKEYLQKILINYDDDFISLLFEKSKGNALYLNYLLSEYQKSNNIDNLPVYNFNLKSYYEYLINGNEINDNVIYALAGLDFRVNETELNEITNDGDYVKETLQLFSPILNEDFSKGGLIIYHESFRRFIIEKLESKNIIINNKIYEPIINWLEEKGFYIFTKSYRNLLILYVKTGNYSKGIDFVNKEFIINSLYNGYNINLIENNHKLLSKCVVEEKNIEKLIYILENSRILATVLNDEFHNLKYIETLMYVKGFEKIKEYLEFEGESTVGFLLGLEICYLLDVNKQNPPWELYLDKSKGYEFNNDEYKKYIKFLTRYALSSENIKLSSRIVKNISKNDDLISIFNNEFYLYKSNLECNLKFIDKFLKNKLLNNIINYKDNSTAKNIDELLIEILEKDIFFEKDLPLINDFFGKIYELIKSEDNQKINEIVQNLSLKNWFYNWCIYFIKILILQNTDFNFKELKEAFSYLILDLEPFKGKPRTMDIYGIEPFIIESIDKGLKLIQNNPEEWKEILDILEKVTEKTTTYLTNIAGGPLTPSKKLDLLKKYLSPLNKDLILSSIEEDVKVNTKIYSELAENFFDLSIYYGKSGLKEKSDEYFSKALIYSISNGYRKDTTLQELINPLSNIYKIDNVKGYYYTKKVENLAWTVISHTEGGKGIKWLPLNWFKEYLDISLNDSILYLLNELLSSSYGYYWMGEEMLEELLMKINGNINPFTEMFIIKTFLNSKFSEKFLNYSLNVFEKVVEIDEKIGIDFLSLIIEKSYIKDYGNPRNDSKNFIDKLVILSEKYNLVYNYIDQKINKDNYPSQNKPILSGIINLNLGISNINSKMTNDELIFDIMENEFIPESKLISLFFIINQRKFDESLKNLINTLVSRNFEKFNRYEKKYNNLDLDKLFIESSEQYLYYKMCVFTTKTGGWFEGFIEVDNFIEVGNIDFKTAIDCLFSINQEKYYNIGVPHDMASNLIISISQVVNKSDLALKMYDNLYDIISFRIPDLIEDNLDDSLINELNLNMEEMLICILISRLRIGSTEISNISISGVTYLLYKDKDLLIKPIKWFFKNSSKFLYLNKQILFQILLDFHNEVDNKYIINFKDEILEYYPSGEYSIDYIIKQFNL
ncbi:MAG: hypothetical protein AB7E37_05200 [Candidatus Altimarinota bacterium]